MHAGACTRAGVCEGAKHVRLQGTGRPHWAHWGACLHALHPGRDYLQRPGGVQGLSHSARGQCVWFRLHASDEMAVVKWQFCNGTTCSTLGRCKGLLMVPEVSVCGFGYMVVVV